MTLSDTKIYRCNQDIRRADLWIEIISNDSITILKAYCTTLWWRWSVFFIFLSNGAPVEWIYRGKPKYSGEKPVPVPLCPPQIPHGLSRDRTRVSAVRGQRLTSWAMARPSLKCKSLNSNNLREFASDRLRTLLVFLQNTPLQQISYSHGVSAVNKFVSDRLRTLLVFLQNTPLQQISYSHGVPAVN